MPKTKEGIELTDCPMSELDVLLNSNELQTLERSIAFCTGLTFSEEVTASHLSNLQGNISVSGLTCGAIGNLVSSHRQLVFDFAVRVISSNRDENDHGEFGPGKEQDASIGHATNVYLQIGFAIGYAITLNFLLHRNKDDHMAYLRNRRTPRPSTWIKELQSILDTLKPA